MAIGHAMIETLLKRVGAKAPDEQAAALYQEAMCHWHKMASKMSALQGLGALYVAPVHQRSNTSTEKRIEQ